MSRSDQARRPRTKGHTTTVRHVRTYFYGERFQSLCTCGQFGRLAPSWGEANNESRDHQRVVYEQGAAS